MAYPMARFLAGLTCLIASYGTLAQTDAEIARFMDQASFGSTPALLSELQQTGLDAWIEKQRDMPASTYPELQAYPGNNKLGCPDEATRTQCIRDNYSMYPLQNLFFQYALNAPDQLRQRVAFALSQIFVVSGTQIQQPSAMTPYLNLLVRGAFGNYRDVLEAITLSPAMGDYLDMVNNDKPSTDGKIAPNENYAREVLQLFSIGTVLLNQDGTVQKDSSGTPLPAYTQEEIEGLAHVFTGWTYAPLDGAVNKKHNPQNYLSPMIVYRVNGKDSNHDKAVKLIPGPPNAHPTQLPANQDSLQDLTQALDTLFNHPNVAPFISVRLIRQLITSNPSPAYVERVSRIFNDNGSGIRGDLFATVRAILMDPEARNSTGLSNYYGHLREPVLLITHFIRALGVSSDGILAAQSTAMGQNLFNSPTVFNYYPLDYLLPGSTLYGPEFALQSSSALISRNNFFNSLIYGSIQPPAPAVGTRMDFTPWLENAAKPDGKAMIEQANVALMHGTMSDRMKSVILQSLSCTPDKTKTRCSDAKSRAQAMLYLVATSPNYQIQR